MYATNLTRQRVRQEVSADEPGFYRLGTMADGQFCPSYFGRSDTDLQRRLQEHAQRGWFTHFITRPADSIREAFEQECLDWHLHGEQMLNHVHPARPDGAEYGCPYCDFENRLEDIANDHKEIYVNAW